MAVTYTSAAKRDAVRARGIQSVEPLELALAAASLAALCLVFAAYAAVVRVPRTESPTVAPINLNTVSESESLEPALEVALPLPGDRRLAARELFAYLVQADGGRRIVPNVGTIGHVRVSAAAIDRAAAATTYRERLRQERERATAAGRAAPDSIALLTPAQLSALKPSVVVRELGAVRMSLFIWATLYIVAFHAVSLAWRVRAVKGDRLLLGAAHLLTALGLAAMISRQDPLRDALLFVRYAQGVIAGLAVAGVVSFVNVRTSSLRSLSYLPLAAAFLLSLLLLSPLGSGPSGSGAKVNLGPFQPIEAIRILLALFLAGYFARNWELLRAVRSERIGTVALPAWLNLPRARYALPVFIGVGLALALFFGQRDLGPALMLAVVFLAAYAVARGTIGMVVVGACLLGAGFYLGYQLEISSTLADRIRMWGAPWDNTARGGDQIAQALWSMSAGGLFGTGIGLGDTRYLPAGHTDLVLAAVAEELGFAGLAIAALLYTTLIARAISTARRASTDYGFFLAITLALFLCVPVLLMASGIIGLAPLTGVVTPFLSFGGSAMVANFAALGLLASIRSDRGGSADLTAFASPVRWLGAALAVSCGVLLVAAGRIQVTRADDLVAKPHLGVQADGMRRFQYNPRLLDIVRRIPRGSIVDRNGLPLATDDRELIRKSLPAFAKIGVAVDAACPNVHERCYPLGSRAFHVIGDATTRRNWSASNSSFVERDSESRLRGFDDHQSMVPVRGAEGTTTTVLRREYRDLVPLLRHRYDSDHPAVRAAMDPQRQLRVTLDARLQARVAAIVAAYARRSASGRAAAVVLDPVTGDLLASVSYPWPAASAAGDPPAAGEDEDAEPLLDRARYGLYPPGSTFKLITAAAALRRDGDGAAQTFMCSRLPDNRVGARVPGYARPVRDDVMDREPHGTLDLHRALVVSCNAYFAQLAVRLGPQALLDAAQPAEIMLARNNALSRIRDTLPQLGYGQGEVVASPLRMARIAAAMAGDGAIRDVRLDASAPIAAPHPFVSGQTARALARYMRDVVLEGTGRSLRSSAVAIAGKTGTAELTGAPSHSWFIGFAPYGPASRRVAVAVILENAGYGGTAAAPAAGEIIEAAAALGLAR
jgi:cell division protein FtsW (lipid II flippase)/cell division protein FtsI/penicillin-binding protein 2